MGNVPEEFQIVPEDFASDDRDLVNRLAGPINNYVLQLNSLLNLQSSIIAEFPAGLTLDAGAELSLQSNIIQPSGVLLTGWANVSNPAEVLSTMPGVQWRATGAGKIIINGIGLTPGERYRINLMIFQGVE